MTLRLGNDISNDERYAVWVRVVERIYDEQVNQAWSDSIFRILVAVFTTNLTLSAEGGFIFNWLAKNYADSSLMLIRRELDLQAGAENLKNLLFDMNQHAALLSRVRYRAMWGGSSGMDEGVADTSFNKLNPIRVTGNPNLDHIDPGMIRADLDRVEADAEQVRKYAELTRAHRSPEQSVATSNITLRSLQKAILDVQRVVEKYYTLLTLKSIAQWEPYAQFDRIAPFLKPWVIDRDAISAAIADEGKRKRPE